MAAEPRDAVPKFSLDKPRYDQSTFLGRLKTMMTIVNPMMLFVTDEKLQKAQELLQQFKVEEGATCKTVSIRVVCIIRDSRMLSCLTEGAWKVS